MKFDKNGKVRTEAYVGTFSTQCAGDMLEVEGFQKYIIKYQHTPNNKRLKLMIEDIVKAGMIQKDDLTIVTVDSVQ